MGCISSCFRGEDVEELEIQNDSAYDTHSSPRESSQALLPMAVTSVAHTPSSSSDNSLPGIYRFPSGQLPHDADPGNSSSPLEGFILRFSKESNLLHRAKPLRSDVDADINSVCGGSKLNMSASDVETKQKFYKSSLGLSWLNALSKYELCQSSEEDDVCPTCLEEYTSENPRIVTNCSHHFHLGCIYEWLERSETCPICDKVMEFDETT